jgi:hypothetical protein
VLDDIKDDRSIAAARNEFISKTFYHINQREGRLVPVLPLFVAVPQRFCCCCTLRRDKKQAVFHVKNANCFSCAH